MLANAPGRRTQREELKIRVSAVRFCPWPLRPALTLAIVSDGNRDVFRLVDRYVSGRQYVSDQTFLRIFHRSEPSARPAGRCRVRSHLGAGSRKRRAELG